MNSSTPSNNLILQFQRISNHYSEEKDIQTSIEQLAEILCCTRRNVNNVISRMSQQGWLSWQPARGRGKLSRLVLHIEAKQPILQLAKHKADQGLLEEAFSLLDEVGDKTSLFNYLKTQLGFQHEVYGNQSLRIPYHRPLPILDPGQATRIAEIHMINQVMDTLVIFDRGSQQIRPSLAHNWRSDKDGTQWQFFLRPGIKFHHGRQLLAEDVAATLQHLKTTASPFQSLYQHIEDIQCPEPLSLQIKLHRRDYLLLHLLANHSSVIKPMELIKDKDFARRPVGTGPFMITQNNDFQLELTANTNYFRERPLLDRIEIWFFTDLKEPLGEDSDLFINDNSQLHNNAGMQQNTKLEKGYQYLLFNIAKPSSPLQTLRIRRSIRSMLNTHKLVEELGGTRAAPAKRLLPEWESSSQKLMFPVRPRMPMRLQYPLQLVTYNIHMPDALWIKKSLAEYDIPLTINELTYAQFSDPENWLEADLVLSGEALGDNLEMALYEWFATQTSLRHCVGDDIRQTIDSQLRETVGLPQQSERMEAFRQLDIFLQQQLVLMPLYHHQQSLHYDERVQGLRLNSWGWVDFKDIWFT